MKTTAEKFKLHNYSSFPTEIEELGKLLFDQQMWCWGQDVLHPKGNLLVKYGFTRNIAPEEYTRSVYTLYLTPESKPMRKIILRAFGLFYGDSDLGGLFIKRYEFKPKLTPKSDLPVLPWKIDLLPKLDLPNNYKEVISMFNLLYVSLNWINSYEKWILTTLGIQYRQKILNSWHNVIAPADKVTTKWQELIDYFDKLQNLMRC